MDGSSFLELDFDADVDIKSASRILIVNQKGVSITFDIAPIGTPTVWRQNLASLNLFKTNLEQINEIQDALKLSTQSIENVGGATKLDLGLVETTPKSATSVFEKTQADKFKVKVIAGESGSGKTVFSVLGPRAATIDTCVLYTKPDKNEIEKFNNAQSLKPPSKYYQVIVRIIERNNNKPQDHKDKMMESPAYFFLSLSRSLLHWERNKEAWEIAFNAFQYALTQLTLNEYEENSAGKQGKLNDRRKLLQEWWSGQLLVPIPHLTLVIDEAVQLDFAKALVDVGINLCQYLINRKVANVVDLVIAGTGLERLTSLYTTPDFGTDPSKASLIIMQRPNLETLEKNKILNKSVLDAIKNGVLARIMSTNARMLFRGVVPILIDPKNVYGLDKVLIDPSERLTKIGSIYEYMDYGIRVYLTRNTVGNIKEDKKRFEYLSACFYHHLRYSQKQVVEYCKENSSVFQLVPDNPKFNQLEEKLKDIGLFRGNNETSAALKFLSTLGFTMPIVMGDGSSLEQFTCFHLFRRLQVTEDNPCLFGKLNASWPPSTNNKPEYWTTTKLKEFEQEELPPERKLIKKLNDLLKEGGDSFSLIFTQRENNAQGADVFELIVSMKEGDPINKAQGKLNLYQCKNKQKLDWTDAWRSVGVERKKRINSNVKEYNATPSKGSAAYSLKGAQRLCNMLNKEMNGSLNTVLGERVIVTSKEGSRMQVTKENLPESCKILSKELLEPTISVFQVEDKDSIIDI